MNHWYSVSLKEGRNREVRRLWESQGVRVSRLIRTGYGTVGLSRRIRPGRWEELGAEEVAALRQAAGLEPVRREPRGRGRGKAGSGQRAAGRRHRAGGRK